jgi:NADH:ubiquinone oxidoreductase subunit 2 (subunit N)
MVSFLLNSKMLSDWIFFIPFLVLFLVFLVILSFSLVYIASNTFLNILKPILYITIYFLFFVIVSFGLFYLVNIDVYFYKNLLYFNVNFVFVIILVIILLMFILFFSYSYFLFDKVLIIEYSLMLILALFGIILVLTSNDLFLLYLGIELQSYCFYVLVALKRYSNLSIEASLKYFILGSFASGIYLFGVSIVYGMLGSTNFSQIYIAINLFYHLHFLSLATFFGIIFIFVGILFKLALVPFHF